MKGVSLLDRVSASGFLTLSLTLPPAACAGELQPLLYSHSLQLLQLINQPLGTAVVVVPGSAWKEIKRACTSELLPSLTGCH